MSGLQLLLALFLVLLNALFVAAEFAFVKIRTTQVERLVQEGKSSAGLVREATRKLDTYLSICQLGITIASLGLGWIGEPAFAHLIEPLLAPPGCPEGSQHQHRESDGVSVAHAAPLSLKLTSADLHCALAGVPWQF